MIANRGASADAPENTIAAFELALDQGADAITVDVHLSRDEHPVVIHDFTLERTTDGAGPVREHTMRELKRLDAGSWHAGRFHGQRVQTLQEVLERFRGRTRFWIEIKGGSDLYPQIEEQVVSVMEIYEIADQAIVQSFDTKALLRIRSLNGEIPLATRVAHGPLDSILAAPGPVQAVCPKLDLLSDETVGAVHGAGLQCHAWTINEPAQVRRLVAWRIDGIITDRPGPVRTELSGRWPQN